MSLISQRPDAARLRLPGDRASPAARSAAGSQEAPRHVLLWQRMRCTPERFWVFPGLIDSAYSYLLGLYLGDGCLASHRRGRLEIALDGVYPRVIAECEAAMSLVMPSNRVRVKPRAGDGAGGDRLLPALALPIPPTGPGHNTVAPSNSPTGSARLLTATRIGSCGV